MIKPHGSDALNPLYVMDARERAALAQEADKLPSLLVSSAAAANAVMMGAGYFNPLTGYMGLADALSVAERLRTTSGLFWPVPIVNAVRDAGPIRGAKRIALRDPNVEGNPVIAIQDVTAVEQAPPAQMEQMTRKVFRTTDPKHPGVAAFNSVGSTLVSGPIKVLHFSYFEKEFPATFRTAYQLREQMRGLGWSRVVAFQTRNPMHRAHEELCRMAYKDLEADGILIHMLLGRLKPGDIPAAVRDEAIRKMVDLYFEKDTVIISGYGFDMLYAGPREAVLHAIFRQNTGCSHLIV
ncbi:MAG TPA: hypothetical protein VFF02_09155, partial [Anaeromyxobacteraceae bacterium]|nr:hypothetical protein [Anaeromyxobacteraceae bacterium]